MGGDTTRKSFQFTSMKNIDNKDFKAAWEEEPLTESSTNSSASGFSSDLLEDASSSGPLFELSGLLSNLPRKRGLSMYYEGKSQSFASLGSVESLEDLAKKDNPQRKRLKYCSSYGGLDGHKSYRPKAAIQ